MNYSFKKGLIKGIISTFIFALPIIVSSNPTWANLTIGGAITILVNYLKIRISQ